MTAPVAPMEARCAVCLDTGNKSQQIDGFLDCTACNAVKQRLTLRNYLGDTSPFMDAEQRAWAAYLFAQRQAAPVAPQLATQTFARFWNAVEARNHEVQPAQQVEAVGQDETLRREDQEYLMSMAKSLRIPTGSAAAIIDAAASRGYANGLAGFAQLEAQQAGDVALKAERYDWLREPKGQDAIAVHDPRGFRCFSYGLDEVIDAAIAQGRKA